MSAPEDSLLDAIHERIYSQHVAQLGALSKLREEWASGQATVVAQLVAVREQVARQNGNVARLQEWASQHPSGCEVRTMMTPLVHQVDELKLRLATELTKNAVRSASDEKWETRLAPWVKIIGTLILGALLATGPQIVGLLKVAKP